MRARARHFSIILSSAVAVLGCALVAWSAHAGIVYELPKEFLASGDFNGDGVPDLVVLDKASGNARVGYASTNGVLTWSTQMVTGMENVSGFGVGKFLGGPPDSIAVTGPSFSYVNLVFVSKTNVAGAPVPLAPVGVGPHALAGLLSPFSAGASGPSYLAVASSFNDPPSERLELDQWTGVANYFGSTNAGSLVERLNALDLNTNTPTFTIGIIRGTTNDTLAIWQFTNSPGLVLTYAGLPVGSDYAFGYFNSELLPRFLFYEPGGSIVSVVPLIQTNAMLAFGAALAVPLSEPVLKVFMLEQNGDGSALIQFGDGVQGLTVQSGSPVLTSKYSSGAGAAGNVFSGVVPLGNGQFALLDAPAGAASAHAQVISFDRTNFTQLTSSALPLVSSRSRRANVWLFQSEPFVNRSPGFVASFNSPDWADGVNGLPGTVQVPTESDGGTNGGLGSPVTNSFLPPPISPAYGFGNQYNPAISIFSYSPPRAAEQISASISPPPGSYGSPLSLSFSVYPSGSGVRYRAGNFDTWHSYSGPFTITNDLTVQYYGTNSSGIRSGLKLASYSLGAPSGGPPPQPIVIDPNNTNSNPILTTNQLTLSQDGTLFYGRVSAAGDHSIWAINLDGSGDTYITTGARPRVTSNGRFMAFLRGGPPVTQGNTYVRDLLTGEETVLYLNTNYTVGFDWDLSQTNIVLDSGCSLWKAFLGSAGIGFPLALPGSDCYDDAPVVNPVTGALAFHNLNPSGSVAGLYVTTAALNARQRLNLGVAGASWPAWSPDGEWLAFVDGNTSSTAITADAGTNLWIASSDGAVTHQISAFYDGTNRFPHGAIWTPDGFELASAATIFGTNGLWLIPLTVDYSACDGPPILLPTTPGDAIDFAGSIVVGASTTLLGTQPTGLFIRQAPSAVIVYWSSNYTGYTLEYKSSLSKGSFWTPINGPYFLAGNYFEYWEPNSALASQKYFRLHFTGSMVLSELPAITMTSQPGTVSLSWPTNIAGLVLVTATNLTPPVLWQPVAVPPVILGPNYLYQESTSGGARTRFFRLRGP